MTDSPDVAAAMRLLDVAKNGGLSFQRIAPGPDGPLLGVRRTVQWRDELYLRGFWEPDSCTATRRRRSSLVVPGGLPVAKELRGDALTVLHTVLYDWTPDPPHRSIQDVAAWTTGTCSPNPLQPCPGAGPRVSVS